MKVKAVRGMHDITPDKSGYWRRMERLIADVFTSYAYQEIRMPIVESTQLFCRSIGEVTDIVEKEMYSFDDRNGDSLSLRPEGTASCVRACIENSLLDMPQKLWYNGPMFRYERPQKGRQRQFHQIGVEVFGFSSVEVEAELLLMTQRLWQKLGIADSVKLELNTIGTAGDRNNFKASLVEYLTNRIDQLDDDSQRRLHTNPMRILDSKNRDTQALLANAPKLSDFLSSESLENYALLKNMLEEAGIDVVENQNLVRGLDYYNDVVFEWVSDSLGAQATVCGGGRYDGLVEQLGGKSTPAVGFAMGLERLYLILEAQGFSEINQGDCPDVYLIVSKPEFQSAAFTLSEKLRSASDCQLIVQQQLAPASMKSQFKRADKVGATFALILADTEFERNEITVKDLSLGEQQSFSLESQFDELLRLLLSKCQS